MTPPTPTADQYRHLNRDDLKRLLLDAEKALLADTDSDARRLLHDLQLHQIELEIANRELIEAQTALEASRERFVTLFDFAPVAYLRLDGSGQIMQANLAATRLFGRVRANLEGRLLTTLLRAGDRSRLLAHLHAAFANRTANSDEFRFQPADDEDERIVRLDSTAVTWIDDAASALVTVTDITAGRRTEQALADARRLLDLSLSGGEIGTYDATLPDGPILVDARYLAMLGWRPGERTLDWRTWLGMIHPDDQAEVEARAAPVLAGELDAFEADYRMRHRLGHWVWVMDRGRVHRREVGLLRMAGTHLDITRRREAEEQVVYLVEHDALTNLLNRRGIMRLLQAMQARTRCSGVPYAVAILDLDHLKEINDSYGHPVGDRVLHAVAETLRAVARATDGLGRWGGDELLIAIPDSTEASALGTVERFRAQVSERPIEADGHSIRVTLSAGLALQQPGRDDPAAVIRRADAALLQAKQLGRNRTELNGTEASRKAISIANMIRDAVQGRQIACCAHPIRDLRSRAVVGEELYARVSHPAWGMIDVGGYVYEAALHLGILHRIDQTLIEAAARSRSSPDGDHGRRHALVGISEDLLRHPDLIGRLADALPTASAADRASGLVLLIDPTRLARDCEGLLDALRPLLDRGCEIALEDRGGPPSIQRLLIRLPASHVILDPELVALSAQSRRARTVLNGSIRGIRDLGGISIARNCDDQATLARLAELGVDWGLGAAV